MPTPVDVAPELQEELLKAFKDALSGNSELKTLNTRLLRGTANYTDANRVAEIVGNSASDAMKNVLTADKLPNGRLYYNIGDRTVRPLMEMADTYTADYTRLMQNSMNKKAGISMKSTAPSPNSKDIHDMVGRLDSFDNVKDGQFVMDSWAKKNVKDTVKDFIKVNQKIMADAGLHPVLVRTAEANCCDWCASLAGEYNYWEVNKGDDVWRFHDGCDCTLEFYPTVGPSQTVWERPGR